MALRRTNNWRKRLLAGIVPKRKPKIKVVFICKAGARSKDYARAFQSYLKRRGLSQQYKVVYGGVETRPEITAGANIVISPYFSFPETHTSPHITDEIKRISGNAVQVKVKIEKNGLERLEDTFEEILKHQKHA